MDTVANALQFVGWWIGSHDGLNLAANVLNAVATAIRASL